MSDRDSKSLDAPVTRREFEAGMANVLDEVRSHGVVLEQMQSGQRAILEALHNVKEGLQRDITDLEARLVVRIENLEAAVRQNSADIQKNSADIRKNSEDIRALEVAVTKLRHDFDHRDERQRLDVLESRVEELEKRAGIRSR